MKISKDDFNYFIDICFSVLDPVNYGKHAGKGYLTHAFMSHQEAAVGLLEKYGFIKQVFKKKAIWKQTDKR